MPATFPQSIIGFLRTHVDSFEKLMVLFVVHRAPSGNVSLSVAARIADIPLTRARSIAAELASQGLVRVSNTGQVELTMPAIEDRLALADLSALYLQDRAMVLDALVAIRRSRS